MECPTCKAIHHAKLFGQVRCQECYGRLAQQPRVAQSKGIRQDSARPSLPGVSQRTIGGGLDYRSHSAPRGWETQS